MLTMELLALNGIQSGANALDFGDAVDGATARSLYAWSARTPSSNVLSIRRVHGSPRSGTRALCTPCIDPNLINQRPLTAVQLSVTAHGFFTHRLLS